MKKKEIKLDNKKIYEVWYENGWTWINYREHYFGYEGIKSLKWIRNKLSHMEKERKEDELEFAKLRKKHPFWKYLMDQAERQLNQGNFDSAVELYKEYEKIFSRINWQKGLKMVQELIIKINEQRRVIEERRKLENLLVEVELLDLSEEVRISFHEYIKLFGITSIDGTPLYCNNEKYNYLIELSNNLDFIATKFLKGKLDKMHLITESKNIEKCQWLIQNNIIYILYGSFPDKKGEWLLEQMVIHFTELIVGRDINNLHQIKLEFEKRIKFILIEYLKMQEIFSDKVIPYIDNIIRIDYIGLSSKSIGIMSLLLGDELYFELPGEIEDKDEELEMKESMLTAKIEAIAANTIGSTETMPIWIAVRLGLQNYRFLTFKRYRNDYFLYLLSEGNLGKIKYVETLLQPLIESVVDKPFSGNLRPYNRLKKTLKEYFNERRVF